MEFKEAIIGQTFAPFTFKVEWAKIDELCFSLRDDNPIYRSRVIDAEGGEERIPVPPTFLNSSIQTRITGTNPVEGLGISRRRALHAGQEYLYIEQVYIGDVLTGRTTLTEIFEKQGRSGRVRYLTLQTRFTRDDIEVAVVHNRVAERLEGAST